MAAPAAAAAAADTKAKPNAKVMAVVRPAVAAAAAATVRRPVGRGAAAAATGTRVVAPAAAAAAPAARGRSTGNTRPAVAAAARTVAAAAPPTAPAAAAAALLAVPRPGSARGGGRGAGAVVAAAATAAGTAAVGRGNAKQRGSVAPAAAVARRPVGAAAAARRGGRGTGTAGAGVRSAAAAAAGLLAAPAGTTLPFGGGPAKLSTSQQDPRVGTLRALFVAAANADVHELAQGFSNTLLLKRVAKPTHSDLRVTGLRDHTAGAHPAVTAALVTHHTRADVLFQCLDDTDDDGAGDDMTVLCAAVTLHPRSLDAVKFLCRKGVNANYFDPKWRTFPLLRAAELGLLPHVRYLVLERRVSVDQRLRDTGEMAVHRAIQFGHTAVAMFLLSDEVLTVVGGDIDWTERSTWLKPPRTLLQHAVLFDAFEVVDRLVTLWPNALLQELPAPTTTPSTTTTTTTPTPKAVHCDDGGETSVFGFVRTKRMLDTLLAFPAVRAAPPGVLERLLRAQRPAPTSCFESAIRHRAEPAVLDFFLPYLAPPYRGVLLRSALPYGNTHAIKLLTERCGAYVCAPADPMRAYTPAQCQVLMNGVHSWAERAPLVGSQQLARGPRVYAKEFAHSLEAYLDEDGNELPDGDDTKGDDETADADPEAVIRRAVVSELKARDSAYRARMGLDDDDRPRKSRYAYAYYLDDDEEGGGIVAHIADRRRADAATGPALRVGVKQHELALLTLVPEPLRRMPVRVGSEEAAKQIAAEAASDRAADLQPHADSAVTSEVVSPEQAYVGLIRAKAVLFNRILYRVQHALSASVRYPRYGPVPGHSADSPYKTESNTAPYTRADLYYRVATSSAPLFFTSQRPAGGGAPNDGLTPYHGPDIGAHYTPLTRVPDGGNVWQLRHAAAEMDAQFRRAQHKTATDVQWSAELHAPPTDAHAHADDGDAAYSEPPLVLLPGPLVYRTPGKARAVADAYDQGVRAFFAAVHALLCGSAATTSTSTSTTTASDGAAAAAVSVRGTADLPRPVAAIVLAYVGAATGLCIVDAARREAKQQQQQQQQVPPTTGLGDAKAPPPSTAAAASAVVAPAAAGAAAPAAPPTVVIAPPSGAMPAAAAGPAAP